MAHDTPQQQQKRTLSLDSRRMSKFEESVQSKVSRHGFFPQVKKELFYPIGKGQSDVEVLSEFIVALVTEGRSKEAVNADLVDLIGEKYSLLFGEWLFDEYQRVLEDEDLDEINVPDEENVQGIDEAPKGSSTKQEFTMKPLRKALADIEAQDQPTFHRQRNQNRYPRGGNNYKSTRNEGRAHEDPRVRCMRLRSMVAARFAAGRSATESATDNPAQSPSAANSSELISPNSYTNEEGSASSAPPSPIPGDYLSEAELYAALAKAEKDAKNKSIRCQYWPQCSRGGACRFHHPTALCTRFPNCPKSTMECLFVHPAGAEEPNEKASTVQSHVEGKRNAMAIKTNPAMCRYGNQCHRSDCRFEHGGTSASVNARSSPKSPTFCKDGAYCKQHNCKFGHYVPKGPSAPTSPTRT